MNDLKFAMRRLLRSPGLTTIAVLIAVSLLATWLPGRRAAKVNPMEALRCE